MIRNSIDVLRAGLVAGVLLGAAQYSEAADVSSYFVGKGTVYQQSSAAAPVPIQFTPAEFLARLVGDTTAISSVTLTTPSDLFPQLPLDQQTDRYETTIPAAESDLNTYVPNGNYTFSVNGGT